MLNALVIEPLVTGLPLAVVGSLRSIATNPEYDCLLHTNWHYSQVRVAPIALEIEQQHAFALVAAMSAALEPFENLLAKSSRYAVSSGYCAVVVRSVNTRCTAADIDPSLIWRIALS